jgi:hypothetical protein
MRQLFLSKKISELESESANENFLSQSRVAESKNVTPQLPNTDPSVFTCVLDYCEARF